MRTSEYYATALVFSIALTLQVLDHPKQKLTGLGSEARQNVPSGRSDLNSNTALAAMFSAMA